MCASRFAASRTFTPQISLQDAVYPAGPSLQLRVSLRANGRLRAPPWRMHIWLVEAPASPRRTHAAWPTLSAGSTQDPGVERLGGGTGPQRRDRSHAQI